MNRKVHNIKRITDYFEGNIDMRDEFIENLLKSITFKEIGRYADTTNKSTFFVIDKHRKEMRIERLEKEIIQLQNKVLNLTTKLAKAKK